MFYENYWSQLLTCYSSEGCCIQVRNLLCATFSLNLFVFLDGLESILVSCQDSLLLDAIYLKTSNSIQVSYQRVYIYSCCIYQVL